MGAVARRCLIRIGIVRGRSAASGRYSTRPRCYRIIVSGRLGEASRAAFEDLRIEPYGTDTALIGELDLPGLRGVLDRLLGIRLELVELSRVADGTG